MTSPLISTVKPHGDHVWAPQAQESECTGAGPTKGHEDDEGFGKSGEAES